MKSPGHVIGLNLTREPNGQPPLTIDGIPFRYVGVIKVDAPPSNAMTVTVTFLAREIRGVDNATLELEHWTTESATEET